MLSAAGRAPHAVHFAQRSCGAAHARLNCRMPVHMLLVARPTAAMPLIQAVAGGNVSDQQGRSSLEAKSAERRLQRQRERAAYQSSAVLASAGVSALALGAVFYRFWWHMADDGSFPWTDIMATLLLVGGGVVGMEFWARWAHKALWHDYQPGWALHKSHHEPRLGPFEKNDIFAIINAVPAMGLCAYGLFREDVVGGLCFGAGLGITLFGMMYMFVHDGLVHKRFPVGPIGELPYLKRVAVAHKLHHSEKYGGVPWGLFLGPQELEAMGAKNDLDKLVAELDSKTAAAKQ